VSAAILIGSAAAGPWLRWGGGSLLAATVVVALVWLATRARRWLLTVRHAAATAAPGGAVDEITGRTADLEARLAETVRRLARLEALSDAREQDDRSVHDGDVVETLGALLDLTEALRAPLVVPRRAEAPALAAAGQAAEEARTAARKEPR